MIKKTILITGCSTGIGYHAALSLSNRGHNVIASCRREQDKQNLIKRGITTVLLDVNDSTSIHTAFEEAMTITHDKLDVLINNAGYGQAGALEDLNQDILKAQFQTNVFGLMEITRLAIPIMRKQGHGRIINLSSVLGVISLPFRGAYNASKYAVEGLSDTLRLELKSSNIDVITIEPGPIISQFRDTSVNSAEAAINTKKSFYRPQYQIMLNDFKEQKNRSVFTRPPDAVVKKLIHAIESKTPKAKYPVTFPAHLFSWLKRLLPTKALDAILRKVSKKELCQVEKK